MTVNLLEERQKLNQDVLNNIIPKRVPISVSLGLYACAELAGVDPRITYWDLSGIEKTVDDLCGRIPSDCCLLGRQVLIPSKYQSIGSQSISISDNGFIQHPNTHMMEADEYDQFIEDPYAFVVETAIPRTNKNLDFKTNPTKALSAIYQANQITNAVNANMNGLFARMAEKYGYPQGKPFGGGGYAPFDILTDQLRSFSGMLTDIRRYRDKVKAAVEAVYPMNYKSCLPPDMSKYDRSMFGFYPLHMATFMREKDFAELWWPTFKRQWTDFASLGIRSNAFLEDDWTKLLDYVQDLPAGSIFKFEYGDPKLIKEKLGSKFILDGGFPISNLTQCSKQQCIDKTKEWIDIMAPGGQYIFGFDKSILVLNDCNIDNLEAVVQTVLDEGKYSNAGQSTGVVFNKKDYTHSEVVPFKSRAYQTWEQYLALNPNTPEVAKPIIEDAEYSIFKFIYSLMQ